ncbi:MAG: hypothetical protein ACI4V4_06365 [Eubacterium sp.]
MANTRLLEIAEAKEKKETKETKETKKEFVSEDISDDKLTAFYFDDKLYYYAVRDNILVFDHHKELFYTLSIDDIKDSEHPFFRKIYFMVCNQQDDIIKLFIGRNGSYESLSFTRRVDAVFIFRKLKRVASRENENIDEIILEKNGVLIDSYKSNEEKQRFYMNFRALRNRVVKKDDKAVVIEESPEVSTLIKVEDTIDSLIGDALTKECTGLDNNKLEKCIKLLNSLKK